MFKEKSDNEVINDENKVLILLRPVKCKTKQPAGLACTVRSFHSVQMLKEKRMKQKSIKATLTAAIMLFDDQNSHLLLELMSAKWLAPQLEITSQLWEPVK